MRTAKEVAEWAAAAGRAVYEEDGSVTPMLSMIGEGDNGLLMHPSPRLAEQRVSVAYAEIIYRIGCLYPWRMLTTVSEAWTKTYAEDDPVSDSIIHGDLEALAGAGDPLVRTCVHVCVLDIKDWDQSYSISSVAVQDKPPVWDISEYPGLPQGEMPDMMRDAFLQSKELTLPDPSMGLPPLALLADVLVEADLAEYAHVLAPGWGWSLN